MTISPLLLYASPASGLWGDYLKTLLVLAGICMLAMGAAKVLLPRLRTRLSGVGQIRVVASHSLEPRKTLYVVKIGNTAVLLATSGTGVHFMTTLDQTDFREEPSGEPRPAEGTAIFRNITQLLKGRTERISL
jgi:flagellar biogenesis protein FliO